jgi:hypothetical protein
MIAAGALKSAAGNTGRIVDSFARSTDRFCSSATLRALLHACSLSVEELSVPSTNFADNPFLSYVFMEGSLNLILFCAACRKDSA